MGMLSELSGKAPAYMNTGDMGLYPRSLKDFLEEIVLQYSCQEKFHGQKAWWGTVQGVQSIEHD